MKLRGFLIFLACAVPVALMSPWFWMLVNTAFGAQPITVIHHDGVAQATVSGPKSPWPDWAVRPEVERFEIQTYYAAAPGHPALGFANIESRAPAAAGQKAYAARLKAAGWTVETALVDAQEPSSPPHPIRMCLVEARLGARSLLFFLQDGPEGGSAGRLHWSEGPAGPATHGSVGRPC